MRKRQSSNATLDSQMYERVGISSNKLEVFSVAMAHESHWTTFPNTRTIDFLSSHCLFPLKLGNEGAQEVRSNGQKERPELNCCEFLGVSAHQGPEGGVNDEGFALYCGETQQRTSDVRRIPPSLHSIFRTPSITYLPRPTSRRGPRKH
jgi:hypothetical protein